MTTGYYLKLLKDIEKKKLKGTFTLKEKFIQSRIESYLSALERGMKYFYFQSPAYKDSGSFCRERSGKIFSIDELMSWKNSEDKPTY